jgi:hypothetical protein
MFAEGGRAAGHAATERSVLNCCTPPGGRGGAVVEVCGKWLWKQRKNLNIWLVQQKAVQALARQASCSFELMAILMPACALVMFFFSICDMVGGVDERQSVRRCRCIVETFAAVGYGAGVGAAGSALFGGAVYLAPLLLNVCSNFCGSVPPSHGPTRRPIVISFDLYVNLSRIRRQCMSMDWSVRGR